ncbi:transposase [Burkholderia pyrrocinia]|uniref:transposase n=1 Tax=Burkholderia pyrrocinia TaxID=60550 RepID=UPI0034A02B68
MLGIRCTIPSRDSVPIGDTNRTSVAFDRCRLLLKGQFKKEPGRAAYFPTNPTDRARPGSKHHVLVEVNGVPVSAILTGANRNDVAQLLSLVDAIPSIRGTRVPTASRAQGHLRRSWLRFRLASRPTSRARHRTGHRQAPHRTRQRPGQIPRGVERTHSWLHGFRRLRIRFERRSDIHEAFLKLACSLVCWNSFSRTERPF